jgi:hypothetical protein
LKYLYIYNSSFSRRYQQDKNSKKSQNKRVNGRRYFFRIYKRGVKNRVTIETDGKIELAHCDHVKTWTINLISQLRLIRIDLI